MNSIVKGQEIRQMLASGSSYNDIVAKLRCSKSTINYHAKQMGIAKPGSIYNWAEIQAFYDAGNSRVDYRDRFGFCDAAWSLVVKRGAIVSRDRRIPMEDLLVQGRHKTARANLKNRLLKNGLLQNRCYECGLTEWLGKTIVFNLHHINGDGKDNRLENLTLLCPNCHSQTENFAGKNKTGTNQQMPKEKTLYAGPTLQ